MTGRDDRIIELAITVAACRMDTNRASTFEAALQQLVGYARCGPPATEPEPPAASGDAAQPVKIPDPPARKRVKDALSYDDRVRLRAEYDTHIEERRGAGRTYAEQGFAEQLVTKYGLNNKSHLKAILAHRDG